MNHLIDVDDVLVREERLRYALVTRRCLQCREYFDAGAVNHRFCSEECEEEAFGAAPEAGKPRPVVLVLRKKSAPPPWDHPYSIRPDRRRLQ